MSKIDGIARQVYDYSWQLIKESKQPYYPELAIYMREDFWRDCMVDIRGEVSPNALEFFESHTRRLTGGKPEQTLMGYKVYRVLSENHPAISIKKV